MISQNHKNLCSDINNWGCLFMALLATKKQDWTPDEVMAIYNTAKEQGILGDKCYVKSYDAILTLIGSPYRWMARVATTMGRAPIAVCIVRYKTAVGYHFMMHNNYEVYDPYNKDIATYPMQLMGADRVDLLKKKY